MGLRRRLRNQARQATALLEPAVGELGVSAASITGAADTGAIAIADAMASFRAMTTKGRDRGQGQKPPSPPR
jgi:hypothetical protein